MHNNTLEYRREKRRRVFACLNSKLWAKKQDRSILKNMWHFIKSDKTIRFWGICDILFFAWYLANSLIKGNIPFFHDITQTFQTTKSFGHPLPILLVIPVIALYISLPFSGKLLYQHNTKGAIISYIQTPFRLLSASPSLFFIHWPISYFFEKPPTSAIIIGGALILASEIVKLYSVISWHITHSKGIITSALRGTE